MADIVDWFNREFWPTYPNDLCSGRKGPKTEALQAMKRINPDAEERELILKNLKAQIARDRKIKRTQWIENWPHARRYIRNRWWENEVEVIEEVKPEKTMCATCRKEEGRYPVADVLYCIKCYDRAAHPENYAPKLRVVK